MKIHKTSIPIDQFCEPFFCFLPDVNFPTSGSTPAQFPMWGLLLGLSVKSLHVGSQGQTRRDEGSRPLRGGSVIGRAQFVSPIHACFSFGACTIQSRRFWLSSSHFAISNIFVLACILSMRRLVSNRSHIGQSLVRLHSSFQSDDLFIEHYELFLHHHVFMVVSEEPVLESAALSNLIEEVRQGIPPE